MPSETKIQAAEVELNKIQAEESASFQDDGEEVWFIYADKISTAGRIAGGDWLTMQWHPDEGEVIVYPPRRVLRAVAVPGFIGILALVGKDEEKRKLPWKVFQKAAVKAGVRKNFTTDSYIEIKAASAQALEPIWKHKRSPRKEKA